MEVRVRAVCWVLCWVQDTIEALLRVPDVMKSLSDVLRKVKDASRLLIRLQVSYGAPYRPLAYSCALKNQVKWGTGCLHRAVWNVRTGLGCIGQNHTPCLNVHGGLASYRHPEPQSLACTGEHFPSKADAVLH